MTNQIRHPKNMSWNVAKASIGIAKEIQQWICNAAMKMEAFDPCMVFILIMNEDRATKMTGIKDFSEVDGACHS
jgi:hypothetical protein